MDINKQVKFALRPLAYLIHTGDKQVLICACSALLVLTDRVKDTIQVLIDAGVFTHLVELILSVKISYLISFLVFCFVTMFLFIELHGCAYLVYLFADILHRFF